jgi:hypothetical protein
VRYAISFFFTTTPPEEVQHKQQHLYGDGQRFIDECVFPTEPADFKRCQGRWVFWFDPSRSWKRS